jgi:hypothetical protein
MTSIESTSVADPARADVNFEGRWNGWRARGAAHDRAVRRRLRELIPAIVIIAVIVYVFILMW